LESRRVRNKTLVLSAICLLVSAQLLLQVCCRPVAAPEGNGWWKTWITQTAGVTAQSEGWYARDGELFTEDMWGYPDELICVGDYVYQYVYVPGTPNEVQYWLQIDWDSDGTWDEIYYFPEIVHFKTISTWSKTYTHSPEAVTIGGEFVASAPGPKVDILYFKMFYGPGPEWTALKACDIDIMDWPLTRSMYDEWAAGGAPGVSVALTKDNGIFEIDINNNLTVDGLPGAIYNRPGVMSPTHVKSFRQAIALMIDKVAVCKNDFGGMAEICDVKLVPPIHARYINSTVVDMWRVPGGQWYVPPGDLTKAAAMLDADGFVQGTTPNPYYDPAMPGSSQFMRKYPPDWPGRPGSPDMVPDTVSNLDALFFYIRSDKPDMLMTGRRLTAMLRKLGIPVRPTETTAAVCDRQVKQFFGYHLYTDYERLPKDPRHLHDFYTEEFATPSGLNNLLFNGQDSAGTGAMPYSFTWNYATNGMGPATQSVSLVTPGSGSGWQGKWHYPTLAPWNGYLFEQALDEVIYAPHVTATADAAKFVQEVLWGTDAMIPDIPLCRYSPMYTAFKTGWKDIVCEEGHGVKNWWTLTCAYKLGAPRPLTLRVGLAYPVQSLNPVTATSVQDWNVLWTMYDPLIRQDPYTPSHYAPLALAEFWRVYTWGTPAKTELLFRIRPAVWHDGTPVTVSDVAFSILYHQSQFATWYTNVKDVVDVATTTGGTPPPGATATWTADPTMLPGYIRVRLGVLSWMGLHWVGGVPIIMQRIWQNVPDARTYNPITDDADLSGVIDLFEDGSGPFKFVEFVTDDHVTLNAFRNYFLSQEELTNFKKEAFRRVGDADINAVVDTPDLAAVAGSFSISAYQPVPTWQDPRYPDMIYSPPQAEDPYRTGWCMPVSLNHPWNYKDFNYDNYIKIEDLAIVAKNYKRNSGSGPGW